MTDILVIIVSIVLGIIFAAMSFVRKERREVNKLFKEDQMCWWMLLIGLFTGAAMGLFITCIVVAGRRADDAMNEIYRKEDKDNE